MSILSDYVHNLDKELAAGNTTEHSHRPALKTLLQSLNPAVTATNEPQHITAVGAPDFRIRQKQVTTGYVECKDIVVNLDETLKTDQLQRYLKSLHNLVLTNYLEFRWYVHGVHRLTVWLGDVKNNKVKPEKDGLEKTAELLDSFLQHEPEPIGSPKELAQHMARLAHLMGFIINNTLKAEIATGSLHAQLLAFRENLIPELSVGQFADMYAQTIAYGLFAARCETDNGKDFTRQNAGYLLPKTNPFLRKLFSDIAGTGLDERLVDAVDDLAQILAQADMAAILEGFGKSTGKEDPVVHFYETFLKEYDPKTREMRGVYYTPLPVVSYIVRSIDHLLKTRFDKPQGLADPSVLVLDPAVGTATFLYVVMQEIHDAVIKQGQAGTWNDYVAEKLLPRLFGFELLMAPYAIAHLKLGLLLKETGYDIDKDKRLNIYLTNTLDEAVKKQEQLAGFNEYIVEEANAAADIKKTKPIMVVLGNPPYSVSSLNRGAWIENLVEDYKQDLKEKKLNLDDDYIKFIRFAQWRIEKTGYGILGFITNNSYLDGLTHRRMREYLLGSFSNIYILNLHGSSRKGEQSPENTKDENVFDIQQGVSIGIFVKELEHEGEKHVYYADMWGAREGKYKRLSEADVMSTGWQELTPTEPHFFFVPKDFSLAYEYEQMPSVKDIFTVWQSALNTDRDELFLDSNRNELKSRMELFFSKKYGDDFKEKYRVYPSSSYDIEARRDKTKFAEANIRRCLHRPFDECVIYYDPQLTSRPVYEVMRHMLQSNIALICARQTKEDFAVLATTNLCTHKIVTVYDRSFVFPLYLYPTEGEMQFEEGRRPNLNPNFIKDFSEKLGLQFVTSPPNSPSPSTERGSGGEVSRPGGEVRWCTPAELWLQLKPLARQMRREPTEAEEILWQHLRAHHLQDYKFRRQHAIERFIVDFYCAEAGLVIEIDGPIHQYSKEEDSIRQTYIESQGLRVLRFSNEAVLHNLDEVIHKISASLTSPPNSPSLSTERGSGGEVSEVFTPEDIFNYAYAVFHSPTYRTRYAEFLKIDFPRLPLTSDKKLFKALAEKGAELVSLHLMQSPALNTLITQYPVDGSHAVEKVSYDEKAQRVYINKTQYFEGVPPLVWNFHIGGYQVCEKWLKDRQKAHRILSVDDINHYQKIVVALKETIRLMGEIDQLIPSWPMG